MWIPAVTVTFILTITVPKWTAGVSCSAEGLQECQLKHLRYLHTVNETESEAGYNTYCDNLKHDSECPLELSEDCKKKYPSASGPYIATVSEMSRYCNRSSSDRHIWFKVGFCTMKHPKEFQKCFKYPIMHKDLNQPDCEVLKFQGCFHDTILEMCGEGREKLANYIKRDMQRYEEYCGGCVSTISNHWILILLSFFSLILRLKFLY